MIGEAKTRSKSVEKREFPWQAVQRQLAAALSDEARRYASVRQTTEAHWRFGPARGSWLSRARSGVIRSRNTVDEYQ